MRVGELGKSPGFGGLRNYVPELRKAEGRAGLEGRELRSKVLPFLCEVRYPLAIPSGDVK